MYLHLDSVRVSDMGSYHISAYSYMHLPISGLNPGIDPGLDSGFGNCIPGTENPYFNLSFVEICQNHSLFTALLAKLK
jgi:hypothetical protein